MKLISIKPGRHSRLVWLKFDNSRLLPLKIDDLVTQSITKNIDINSEKLNLIELLSLSFILEEYALRQIAISPKIKSILLPKLKNYCLKASQKYGYPTAIHSNIINNTLQTLEDKGLLNDQEYISYFIKRHSKKSRAHIVYTLNRLGIDTANVLPFIVSDIDNITKIINKKYSKIDFSDYHSRNKVYSALGRLGFALGDIKTAIDEYLKIE